METVKMMVMLKLVWCELALGVVTLLQRGCSKINRHVERVLDSVKREV